MNDEKVLNPEKPESWEKRTVPFTKTHDLEKERDWNNFFQPQDFGGLSREFWFPELLKIANDILRKTTKEAPQINGYIDGPAVENIWWDNDRQRTHTGRIVAIREVEPT